jgi:hypothetical protein
MSRDIVRTCRHHGVACGRVIPGRVERAASDPCLQFVRIEQLGG